MSILTHSQDIMYLSIALGVLLVSLIFAWLLFYLVMTIKDMRTIVAKTKETLTATHEVVTSIKTKIDQASIQFKFLLEGIKTIMEWVNSKKENTVEPNHLTSDKKTKK